MNSMFKKTFAKFIIVILICFKSKVVIGEIFTLGYLTGSQRRSGNLDYHIPGLTISGAISLAVSEINLGKLKTLGHSLAFIFSKTYGEEVSSIRQTASLWKSHISGLFDLLLLLLYFLHYWYTYKGTRVEMYNQQVFV